MNTGEEMAEFVIVWDLILEVQINEQEDEIVWRWTSNGVYSTSKSAYLAQLKGTHSTFQSKAIWRAHAEEKLKFSGLVVVQCKMLMTADKLVARNWLCVILNVHQVINT
jgi:hypothetical protein